MATYGQMLTALQLRAQSATGHSLDKLAKAVGLSGRSALGNAKTDPTALGLDKVMKIADLAGCTETEKDELIFEYFRWCFAEKKEGRKVFNLLKDAIRFAPKERRGKVLSRIATELKRSLSDE